MVSRYTWRCGKRLWKCIHGSNSRVLIQDYVLPRVYNEERVSNAPQPNRKHSRESNMMCT